MKNLIERINRRRFYDSSLFPLLGILGLAAIEITLKAALKVVVPVLVVIMFFAVIRIENKIDAQTETINAIEAQENSTAEAIVFEWIRGQLEQLGETE